MYGLSGNRVLIVNHEDESSSDGLSMTRTWTAMDRCGNIESIAQTIRHTDTQAPSFTFVPADQQITCGESLNFAEARAQDACGTVSISYTDATVEVTGGIKITRTWIATDEFGNEAEVSRSITQIDNVAPVFTFTPADQNINCGEEITFGVPSAEDACSEVTITF